MSKLPFEPTGLRALLFDLDGTLYAQGPVRRAMTIALLAHVTLHPVRGSRTVGILRTYRELHERTRERAPGSGVEDWHVDETARRAGVPREEVERVVDEWMLRRPLPHVTRAVRPGLGELLDAAAARGLRLGVLSDYPVEAKLGALGLRERFDVAACTSEPEIDAPKPAADGFRFACDAWDLPPATVLYVGDREEVDRSGARAAGLPCVLMGTDHAAPCARDFHELGGLLGLLG